MKIFRVDSTSLKDLKDLYEKLIWADLDNKKSITLQILFDVNDNDTKEYEEEYMTHSKPNSLTKTSNDKIKKGDLSPKNSLTIGAIGYIAGEELNKIINWIN